MFEALANASRQLLLDRLQADDGAVSASWPNARNN
jgi:hypothetical protein